MFQLVLCLPVMVGEASLVTVSIKFLSLEGFSWEPVSEGLPSNGATGGETSKTGLQSLLLYKFKPRERYLALTCLLHSSCPGSADRNLEVLDLRHRASSREFDSKACVGALLLLAAQMMKAWNIRILGMPSCHQIRQPAG